jgi:hypothetical protein
MVSFTSEGTLFSIENKKFVLEPYFNFREIKRHIYSKSVKNSIHSWNELFRTF